MRRYFDPKRYRIILFDQRGCGKSKPHASLENNTTPHLCSDMEKLRVLLKLEKWIVFGGSWGSTLSLYYAQAHPQSVSALILRGIFGLRKKEIDWFYQNPMGAAALFPDQWEDYTSVIPEKERDDMVKAYYKRLCHPDEKIKVEASTAWSRWELATSYLHINEEALSKLKDDLVKSNITKDLELPPKV